MSFAPLDNPLERLAILPNAMNWRGTWDATEQYFKNDVVVSPTNSASYILAGQTALLGGADPQFNVDWIELSLPTTGVASVNAGVGITLDPLGTATNPIIDNDGVITLTAGAGMFVDNTDPHNPIVENIGVHSVGAGTGIALDPLSTPQIPIINNDGVITLSGTSGVNVDNSDPHNPIVSNTGVITVSAGSGISVSALSLVGDVQISNNAEPTLCYLEITGNTPASGPIPIQTAPPNNEVSFQLTFPTLPTTTKFLDILQDATKNGGFLMDFSAFCFYIDQQNIAPPSQMVCSLIGFKAGGGPPVPFTFPITSFFGGEVNFAGNVAGQPPTNMVANGGQVFLDLASYRVASVGSVGIATAPNRIVFTNLAGVPVYATSFPRKIMCRYYPNGLQ